MQRRSSLRPKPKGKGNRGERAVVDMCHDYGWTHARRNFASGGQGGADIINGPDGVSLEVKWCERAEIWKWIAQSEAAARPTEIPAVVFKRNHGDWWVCAPSDEWDTLDEIHEPPRFTVVREQERAKVWDWLEVAMDGATILPGVPRVRFRRSSSSWYTIGPAEEFFAALRDRELAA